MKIKIFENYFAEHIREMEERINQWLRQHPTIEVLHMSTYGERPHLVLTILYKETSDEV